MDVVPETDRSPAYAAYLRSIDRARRTLVVVAAAVGLCFVVCASRDDYLRGTLRQDPGLWAWATAILACGVCACFAATFLFLLEPLARPVPPKPFSLRSILVRLSGIVGALVGVGAGMAWEFGAAQAAGAVLATWLVIAAVRHREMRVLWATIAVIVAGLTILGTQTPFQYARRHADEIVAAGSQLIDRCPAAAEGLVVLVDDPRVPQALLDLGAQRIWVDAERVAVYIGGDTEFTIYRHGDRNERQRNLQTHRPQNRKPQWVPRPTGKGGKCPITNRLSINNS